MKAIILAGGRGKRLKPLTDYVPKPLIPIQNIPIIERQISYLKKFGVTEVIISTGYRTEQIENFLKARKNLGVKIIFSKEKTPLGTGGAIKKAKNLIKDKTFFVINGDVITNIDLNKLKAKENAIAAIELRTKFGVMETASDKVVRFSEKKEISGLYMNAGIYHLSQSIFKDLPSNGDIERTTFPKYSKDGTLYNVKFENVMWYSIDSYKDMEDCSKEIEKSE